MDTDLATHREFWLAEHNPARTGPPLRSDSTVADHQTHLRAFATFAAEHLPDSPSNPLPLLASPDCTALTAWLNALAARGVGKGTRAGYCNSVISYLKAVDATVALSATQRVRSALQQQYDAERKARSDKVALAAAGKFAEWDDISEATRELVRQWRELERMRQRGGDGAYDGDDTPLARRCARAATIALMALINTALPPSRSLELRTLEIPVAVAPSPAEERNVVVATADGGYQLCFDRFKTVKSLARQVVTLPENADLLDALHAVAYTHRTTLVGRTPSHRFLFVGPSGKPYASSGAWANALNGVFAAPLAKVSSTGVVVPPRVGTNVLRKSSITQKLPECTTLADRESLAAAFRHGLDAQKHHYDCATSSERVSAAVNACAAAYAQGGSAGAAPRVEDSDSDSSPSATDEAFAVDKLLQHRIRGGEHQYSVRWATGPADDSWEPEDEMPAACVREFWRRPSKRARAGE
jgi:hypothetical protein